jgi:DNA-binding response OmpR family regulator
LVGSLKNAIADAELFIIQPNRCSRTAWGPAQEGQTEYLRVAMRALRRKLERDPSSPAMPIDELGVGYRLRAGRD